VPFSCSGPRGSLRSRPGFACHLWWHAPEASGAKAHRSPGRYRYRAATDRRVSIHPSHPGSTRACGRPRRPAGTARAGRCSAGRRCRKPRRSRRASPVRASAVESTIIAFWPPVSATSVASGPLRAASERLIAQAASVEPVNATPAEPGITKDGGTDLRAPPGQQMQRIEPERLRGGATALLRRNQRRRLGRLRKHGVFRPQARPRPDR
jgi:hypothetical protein